MHSLVVLGDRLDVGVPAVLSSHLLNSFLLVAERGHSASKSLVASVSERPATFSSWGLGHLVPFEMRLSQKRDACSELRSFGNLTIDFIFVRNISIEYERSSIERCLESALS